MTDLWLVGWRRLVLAFGLGAVAALGQAPLGFWWATIPALGGLIWLLGRHQGLKPAFWTGLAAGSGYFALALSWIVEPFLVDIARHGWMAPFALVGLSVGLGLFWAVAAALAAALPRPALAFVASFVALEWLRGVRLWPMKAASSSKSSMPTRAGSSGCGCGWRLPLRATREA